MSWLEPMAAMEVAFNAATCAVVRAATCEVLSAATCVDVSLAVLATLRALN